MTKQFDFERCITDYRKAIEQREAATTKAAKAKFAPKLRDAFQTCQGEDSLHEMTFGEPECE